MISIGLTTMVLTVTIMDPENGDALVTGATVTARIVDAVTKRPLKGSGISWPASLIDQNDGTYKWTYPSAVRTAMGIYGEFRLQVTASKSGQTAYGEYVIHVRPDGD